MSTFVKCQLCGKEIGKTIIVDFDSINGVGTTTCKDKIDFRKASRVYLRPNRKKKTSSCCLADKATPSNTDSGA